MLMQNYCMTDHTWLQVNGYAAQDHFTPPIPGTQKARHRSSVTSDNRLICSKEVKELFGCTSDRVLETEIITSKHIKFYNRNIWPINLVSIEIGEFECNTIFLHLRDFSVHTKVSWRPAILVSYLVTLHGIIFWNYNLLNYNYSWIFWCKDWFYSKLHIKFSQFISLLCE